MAQIEHRTAQQGNIHTPFNWVVADAAARDALMPGAGDVNKVLLQLSDDTAWRLDSVDPVVWKVWASDPNVIPYVLPAASSGELGGVRVTVSESAPAGSPADGDIWFQI